MSLSGTPDGKAGVRMSPSQETSRLRCVHVLSVGKAVQRRSAGLSSDCGSSLENRGEFLCMDSCVSQFERSMNMKSAPCLCCLPLPVPCPCRAAAARPRRMPRPPPRRAAKPLPPWTRPARSSLPPPATSAPASRTPTTPPCPWAWEPLITKDESGKPAPALATEWGAQ